jgi:hypothetical protein
MIRVLAVCVIVCVPSLAAAQGITQRVADLEARMASLEIESQPTQVDVDCDAGGSVQAVLNQYRSKPAALSIGVRGTCYEHLIVSRDDVTILGLVPGAGFRTTSTTASLISVRGAQRARLFDLALQGGQIALQGTSDASVLAVGVQVSGAVNGVNAADALIELRNATVENNTGFGVWAQTGSRVTVTTSAIRNNGLVGAQAIDASLRIRQSVIEANQGGGIGGLVGARVDILGGTIRNNAQAAIVLQAATLRIEGYPAVGQAIISGNAGGIGLFHGSSANLRGVTIENNTQFAIGATGGSSVFFSANANLIRNNVGGGIGLNDSSTAGRFTQASLEITGNQSGIRCQAAPGVAQIVSGPGGYVITLANVFGNGGVKQIDCPGF